MKVLKILVLLMIIAIIFTVVSAGGGGDIKKGKELFNDPGFGGGAAGKSCNTCHPGGKGLEKVLDKKEINLMGNKLKSLEEAVNMCIKNPMKGKGIDVKSAEMANIVAYIKSLKKPAEMKQKKTGEKAW
ncbi:MAG: hypothetical protein AB1498_05970 [bacterium]